jgi:hypothetical protein
MHRQIGVIALVVGIALTSIWLMAEQSKRQVISAGFWFEHVTLDATEIAADRLGGAVTAAEMQTIRSVAAAEVAIAFSGLRVRVSQDREAAYQVRVVQELRSVIFPKSFSPAGESRGMWPFGGRGAVNFRLLASNAVAYAPKDADRATMIEAIGRGIGRGAVHEFAHQILGSFDIHDHRDRQTYEYRSADRAEQYYGPMHWGIAGPHLKRRLGSTASSSQ